MPAPANALASLVTSSASGVVSFAHSRAAVVDQFVAALPQAIAGLQAPPITANFPAVSAAPSLELPDTPAFQVPIWVSPNPPAAFTDDLDVSDLTVEPFDDNPPVISYGTAPAAFNGTIPDAPAINLVFDDPTLSVNLPAAPNLLSISVRRFDGLTLPSFDADEPVLTEVAPSIREYVPGAQYTSSLLEETKASLLERIQNGGTGLGDAELAIWERGREREARAQQDAIMKLEQMEGLGYAAPPGFYLDARQRIITETDYAERGHSREVMIKSAELQLENVKHALTTAVQLESRLMDYTNAVEQRLFESTRYATEAGVAIYNAKVQAFSAMVDIYRAKVGAYEALVRAETAKVEAYKAEIAAEEAKARVNQALVEQYRVQVDAALSSIKIYEAQIAGIQAKAEIEKTKVMVFGEQVRGYSAQVNAYTAGVEGFRASLQAEQTKAQVYQAQVDAFGARVNASTRLIEARISAYKGKIDAKQAELEGYKAQVQGESARVQGIATQNSALAESYKAEVSAVSSYNDTLTKQWQAILDQNQRVAEIGISSAKANAELFVTTRSLALDAAKTGATVQAQIGAAAINAFNVSASASASEGYQANESVSNSTSTVNSSSDSTSTNTNYNYSV